MYQELWSDDVQFLRYGAQRTDGQIDGQTDGQTDGKTEKVTYRGGCPTWKDGLFDVTMGACDGAEVCELVGTFY